MGFFQVSKLFWFIAAPSHLLVWMLVAGLIFFSRRAGRILILTSVSCYLVLFIFPVGDWLLCRVESEYPRPAWPAHVDGVLELGGGLSGAVLRSRGVPGAEEGEARAVAAFELARRYPEARIVFSGGGGRDIFAGTTEADVAHYIFGQLGLDPRRVIYENGSRSTWENFVLSRPLAKPKSGETWLLATSAFHMPRAMAVSRRLGWTMLPWPTDYLTPKSVNLFHPYFNGDLGSLDLAVHEWIGLIGYHLAGKAR